MNNINAETRVTSVNTDTILCIATNTHDSMTNSNNQNHVTILKSIAARNSLYIRKKKSLHLTTAASGAGISPNTLYALERSINTFDVGTAVKLSLFYEVTLTDLLSVDLELRDSVQPENKKTVKGW